jgi:hypothetical protein
MSTVKHSPPPWRMTSTGYVLDANGRSVAKMYHWPLRQWPPSLSDDAAQADGRLIVRAPELLHMCNGLRLVLDATSLYVPTRAHPSIAIMLDSSAALLREVTP